MPEHLLTLKEVLAMLDTVNVPLDHVAEFQKQAEFVLAKRVPLTRADDEFQVGSGYSSLKNRSHVRLQAGPLEYQLDPRKAKQIGLWLIEAAEAAIADHCVMQLLKTKVGIDDPRKLGSVLLDLREIRQGTRDVKFEL